MARPRVTQQFRATENEIKEILAPGNDYDDDKKPSLKPFQTAAWVLVGDLIAFERCNNAFSARDGEDCMSCPDEFIDECGTGGNTLAKELNELDWKINKLDSDVNERSLDYYRGRKRHAIVEAWLSAHFYKVSDRILQSQSVTGASGTFMGYGSLGLASTHYGQQAMIIDSSGYLKILNDRQVISGGLTAPGARASIAYVGSNGNCDCSGPYNYPYPNNYYGRRDF